MLIRNLEQIKDVINVSAATDYERLHPHLFGAEVQYIIPVLGRELYKPLLVFATDPDSTILTLADMNRDYNDDYYIEVPEKPMAYAILLWLTRMSMVHLAYYRGFDVLNAYISDGGFRRIETEKVKSLYKYQEDNVRKYFQDTGLDALDSMLKFLEINIKHFPEFEPKLKANKSRIIPDTETFNNILHINSSRLIFMRLQPHIRTVEDLDLANAVGYDNMLIINNGLKSDQVPEKVTAILPYLRSVVAFKAAIRLMNDTGGELGNRGLFFEGIKGGLSMSDVRMPTEKDRVHQIIATYQQTADAYTAQLLRFLNEDPETWDGHENPRTRLHERDNSDKKTFWA